MKKMFVVVNVFFDVLLFEECVEWIGVIFVVLYLIFNEVYVVSGGLEWMCFDFGVEVICFVWVLVVLMLCELEVFGLFVLMEFMVV